MKQLHQNPLSGCSECQRYWDELMLGKHNDSFGAHAAAILLLTEAAHEAQQVYQYASQTLARSVAEVKARACEENRRAVIMALAYCVQAKRAVKDAQECVDYYAKGLNEEAGDSWS